MSNDRDITSIVRSWLRADENESADRVLQDVLALIETNTQRRSWWPAWRFSQMPPTLRIGVAAAAALLVAFLGYQFGSNIDGPAASPSPSAEPTATAAGPSPASGNRLFRSMDSFRFSFELPDSRWEAFGSEYPSYVSKSITGPQGAEAVVSWQPFPGGPFGEACYYLRDKPAGSSIADLATAVASVPGTELVEGPSEVIVGGRTAQHVVFVVREDVGCDPGFFFTYPNVHGGALWPETWPGDTVKVWIVNVNGAFFIEGRTHEDATPALDQEIQQIVDSIQFE